MENPTETTSIENPGLANDAIRSRPRTQGYLITTDSAAKVYVPADSAPALAAAFSAWHICMGRISEGLTHSERKRAMKAAGDHYRKIKDTADGFLRHGVTKFIHEISDPSGLNPSELAPSKFAGEVIPELLAASADPPQVSQERPAAGDRIWTKVSWGTGCLYSVGIRANGSLFNPHGYPEAEVRAAVAAAEERLHQRRCKVAQKAAATRARHREQLIVETAKQFVAGRHIGESKFCYFCEKFLTDPESIHRGIGPECWGRLLRRIEEMKAAPTAQAS